jgi:two-component system OmpR family sensor kinase
VSLSLWLTILFAGFATLVVAALSAVAYVHEARAPYADLDRALAEEGALVGPLLELEVVDGGPLPVGVPDADDVRTFVQLFDATDVLLAAEPRDAPMPPTPASRVRALDGPPAYASWLRWLPGEPNPPSEGAFATARLPDGRRVRLHAQALGSGSVDETVLTWTSLESIDRSVQRFRTLLLVLSLGSVGIVWVGGYLVARAALAPVRTLTGTASQIAAASQFARRVPESDRSDELGVLAATINQMLEALEGAYRAQQRFVADAAHELRTPLTSVRGNAELLARPHLSDEDRAVAVSQLNEAAERASHLVQELLTLARSDAGYHLTLNAIELTSVVLDAVAELQTTRGRAISLGELESVTVRGHPVRLHQLMTILLDNAIKYTPDDGTIEVSAHAVDGQAEIRVRDTGIGITEEHLPHIFDRFYRADRARSQDPGGVGLGLSIGHWIVTEHGGVITAESAPGRGTTFIVRLPLAEVMAADDQSEGSEA